MAFETKLQSTDFSGMGNIIDKADPFSALGKSMTELDGLLDQRQSDSYIKGLDPTVTSSVEGLNQAILQSPNKISNAELTKNRDSLITFNKAQNDAKTANLTQMYKQGQIDNQPETLRQAQERIEVSKQTLKDKQAQTKVLNATEERKQGIEDREIKAKRKEAIGLAQADMGALNQQMSHFDKILNHKGFEAGTGMKGWIMGKMPGSLALDFRAMLASGEAKLFTEQIAKMRGLGSLSDAEGQRISMAAVNLNPDQSPEQLRESINNAIEIMEWGKKHMAEKYNNLVSADGKSKNTQETNTPNNEVNTPKTTEKTILNSITKDGVTYNQYSDGTYGKAK